MHPRSNRGDYESTDYEYHQGRFLIADTGRPEHSMKKTRAAFAIACAAVTALALSGCSLHVISNAPAGSLTDTATPSTTAAAVQAFNAGGYLGGNAKPTFPDGESGKISVVSQSALLSDGTGGASLLFAFRNNTSAAVAHVDFTATATADGKVVASGESQGTIPARVQPGEAGLAYVYFEDSSSIPATGTTYSFKVSSMPGDASPFNTAPLTVNQATNNGTSIIGSAVNKTGKGLTGPYSVNIYCFDGAAMTSQIVDYATEKGDIGAGASVSFSTDLYDVPCATYVVGVSGYFK